MIMSMILIIMSMIIPQNTKNRAIIYPASSLLAIYLKKNKNTNWKDTYTPIVKA